MPSTNSIFPRDRKPLTDLLETEEPSFVARDGTVVSFDRSEIEFLAGFCSEIDKFQLRLPILMAVDVSGDTVYWRVDGRVESKVISNLLGKPSFRRDSAIVYPSDYRILSKKIPSCIFAAYYS